MFYHNLKYTLLTLFRNKGLIFWTFAFPIILGTFFYLAFSDIEKNETLDIMDIAIVENQALEANAFFQQAFSYLGDEDNQDRLFHIQYKEEEEAKELLEQDKIIGYIILTENKPKIVVATSGIYETILKYVTEEISETSIMAENLIKLELSNNQHLFQQGSIDDIENKENIDDIASIGDIEILGTYENLASFYQEIITNVLEMMQESNPNIKDISSKHLSYTMIEFYTLIAMTCLYSGMLGMVAINQNLANMSHIGKRIAISPVPKRKLVLSSAIASYITSLVGILLLFIYTIFVLQVDYGSRFPQIILLTLVGCLAGLSLGIMVACLFKKSDNIKTGMIISITMLGCFLSGMMGITMKYVIDKNIPVINLINPASMITDGFYALYYYSSLDRYYFNVISLLIFTCIMFGISIFSLRRQTYDSI